MRTFPRAWVAPGGGADEGETLAACAAREVSEEVGLEVERLDPLCLWESFYPTSPEACLAQVHTRREVRDLHVGGLDRKHRD